MKRTAAAVLLLIAMLSACGEKPLGNAEGSTALEGGENQAEADIQTEDSYLDTIPEYDFGGGAFRLAVNSQDDRPNVHADEENGEIINDAMIARDRAVSEKYDLELVYSVYDSRGAVADAVTKTVRAGEDAFDVVIAPPCQALDAMVQGGICCDLTQLEALSLGSGWWSQSMNSAMRHNGKIYASAGPMALCYVYSPYAFFVNLSMAQNHSLPDVYQLVTDGKWTIDGMASMMSAVSFDINSDGVMDEKDRYGLTTTMESGKAFYLGCGADMAVKTDGGAELLMDSQRSIDILDRLNAIMKSDDAYCTDGDSAHASDSQFKISFFVQSRALFAAAPLQWGVLSFRDMSDDYAILPYPKYDEAQDKYYTHMNSFFPYGVAVPVTNTRPQETGAVMESLAYLSHTTILPLIHDVVLKEKVARDEQSKKMLDILYENVKIDLNTVYDFGGSASLLREYAVGESDDFASAYAKIEKKVTGAVEKMLESLSDL